MERTVISPSQERERQNIERKERDALSAVVFDAALGGVWRKKLEADAVDQRNRESIIKTKIHKRDTKKHEFGTAISSFCQHYLQADRLDNVCCSLWHSRRGIQFTGSKLSPKGADVIATPLFFLHFSCTLSCLVKACCLKYCYKMAQREGMEQGHWV